MTDPVVPANEPPPADRGPADARHPAPAVGRTLLQRFSIVWLVPVIALLVGATLVARALLQRGPEITIEFRSAEGLEAGRTEVRYKEVVIGRVARVRLSGDRQQVLVDVGLAKDAAGIAVADTRFWVVRPRISAGGSVTGLGTLLAGSHIGMDAGSSTEPVRNFVGSEQPAVVITRRPSGTPVSSCVATTSAPSTSARRSISAASRPGRSWVMSTDRSETGHHHRRLHPSAPYDKLVNMNSRFWLADGFDVTLERQRSQDQYAVGGVDPARRPGVRQSRRPARAAGHRRRTLLPLSGPQGGTGTAGRRAAARAHDVQAVAARAGGRRADRPARRRDRHRAERSPSSTTPRPPDAPQRFPIEVTADLYMARLGHVRDELARTATARRRPPTRCS